jgi:hypothetical protein
MQLAESNAIRVTIKQLKFAYRSLRI